MRIVFIVILSIVGVLSLLFGFVTMASEASAIHQILCAVYFLTFTVCMVGLGIIMAIGDLNATTKSEWNDYAKHLASQSATPAAVKR